MHDGRCHCRGRRPGRYVGTTPEEAGQQGDRATEEEGEGSEMRWRNDKRWVRKRDLVLVQCWEEESALSQQNETKKEDSSHRNSDWRVFSRDDFRCPVTLKRLDVAIEDDADRVHQLRCPKVTSTGNAYSPSTGVWQYCPRTRRRSRVTLCVESALGDGEGPRIERRRGSKCSPSRNRVRGGAHKTGTVRSKPKGGSSTTGGG